MDDIVQRLAWFKATILPHEAGLRARLRSLCPPGFDIDNLVAESLLRAYQATNLERITRGRAYLFTIARHLLIDALRRESIVSLDFVAELEFLGRDESAEAGITARSELRALQAIVDTLPRQCRRVFVMRRVEDLSLGEIAEQLGLSVSTVEKHLAKAVMLVARAWAEREGGGVGRGGSELPGLASDPRARRSAGR